MVNLEFDNTYVVPERHNKNHGSLERIAHTVPSTLLGKIIDVAKDLLLGGAEVRGERASGVSSDLGLRVGNDLAVLDVETSNLRETAVAALVELGDNSNLLGGVDVEAGSRTVEGLVTLTVGVEIATVSITSSAVTVVGVSSTTRVTSASVLSELGARVRSVGSGDGVGLPDVHLGAACAQVTNTTVDIALRGLPAIRVGLYCMLAFTPR
jgi:hypothetical protein